MVSEIGKNLRDLRAEQGLSLRQLSAETGLSPTLLSQVERGIAEPSLKTLRALSSVLGEASSSLFAVENPVLLHISRPGERSRISTPVGSIQYERLTPGNGNFEVLRGTLAPGAWSSETAWSHQAVECVFVDSGTLVIELATKTIEVQTGESVTFASQQAHRYGNNSSETVTFVLTVSPPTP
ncbi:XRE family transcriptional regulator [Leucobacter sp. UT-8R-CII-1-4]|uniref:helix-turn-helix domain-containing protein n=1 Tax=Leucobacter sp. UT-8R-CII-1-4 TaxID=3040075 RepID=UPI0024A8B6BC|nr:XRE family transcriptional regulator [Leucobacter sp. UT-8R-CII-1-4]MDI6023401.1 XRE family transcriptional regulator [Leucobacter sp. UT-8R-CII-1-4]